MKKSTAISSKEAEYIALSGCSALDEALVPINDQVKISASNMRIDPLKKQKDPSYQISLDIIKKYSCYNAFLKTADVPQIYMQQFWSKGKGKGRKGKKKPDAYILKAGKGKELIDPDEALKLGKSISLTEADDQEEECHLHETHARLVTKKEADTADSKETNDDVLDELRDDSGSSSSSFSGSDNETEDISSDKEIKDDHNKADKEIADKEVVEKKIAEEEIANEEIVDREQAYEENVGNELAADDQANVDQAGFLIPETQKEKPKPTPPTNSSLTLASAKYDNQFVDPTSIDLEFLSLCK
ncbi:hypothetical protein Tco_0294422, partial [Tanacetum coccineum]